MIQTFTSSQQSQFPEVSVCSLCSYTNITSRIQIIRTSTCSNGQWEKVVFPGQRLMFEAMPDAKLEIQISEMTTMTVPCQQLSVIEQSTVK